MGNFVDVNNDGLGTALDALRVINRLGSNSPTIAVTLLQDSLPRGSATTQPGLEFDLKTNHYALAIDVSIGELGDETVSLRIGDDSATTHDITDWIVDNHVTFTSDQIDEFYGEELPDGDHPIRIAISGPHSEPIEFTLTVDRRVPELLDVLPKRSVLVGDSTIAVQVTTPGEALFLDLESISLVDSSDASRVFRPSQIERSSVDQGFIVNFDQAIPAGNFELRVDESRIATPAGNAVGNEIRSIPLSFLTPTAIWTNTAGGDWGDAENWQSGEVPSEDDVVLIDVPDGVIVEGPIANLVTIEHLTLRGELRSNSNFQAKTISVDRGTLRISNGSAASDVLYTSRTGDGRIVVEDGLMRIDNGLVEVPIQVGNGGTLLVSGGVELNSTIEIAGESVQSPATVSFGESQQVTGRGIFELVGADSRSSRIISRGQGYVDIADTLTVRGSRGSVEAGVDNPINLRARLVDDGREADESGERSIEISGLGSETGLVDLRIDTPIGLVQLDSHANTTLVNRGSAPIEFRDRALLTNVSIQSRVLVTDTLRLHENATLNSVLTIEGTDESLARISLEGSVNLDGDGEIVFAGSTTDPLQQRIDMVVGSQNLPQEVAIGSGITVRGNVGTFLGSLGADLDFSGTVVGDADTSIVLRHIATREGFRVNSIDGAVTIDDPLDNLKVSGIGNSVISVLDDQRWNAAELMLDIHVEAGAILELSGSATAGSTTISGDITLLGDDTDRAQVLLTGTEPVVGDGAIIFAGDTTKPFGNLFKADLKGGTLDPRITISGRNGLFGGEATYAGSITVTDDGTIAIGKLSGDGDSITIDSRDGTVLAGELESITVNGIENSDIVIHPYADLGFPGDGFDLDTLGFDRLTDVTLNLPVRMLGGVLLVAERMELNSTFTMIGDEDTEVRGDLQPANSRIQFQNMGDDDKVVELTGNGAILFGPSINRSDLVDSVHIITGANTSSISAGPDITLGGQSGTIGQIVHAGPLASEAGAIIHLRHYVTSPGRIDLTPQAGRLYLHSVDSDLDSVVIDGTEGSVLYTNGLGLNNPTINIPLFVQNLPSESFRVGLVVDGDLQLNSTLTLVDQSTFLALTDDDRPSDEKLSHLLGTGTVVLAQFDPNPNDDIAVSGHSISSANSLTIEAGVTIRAGKGSISSGDVLRIRGIIIDLHGQLNVGDVVDE
ncbi:hypothetical protein Pla22_19470 [Rubripirellula amarantea]|uniref:Dockerin type I repeat protein n=1 Tax=Rubripirellula amarantea TaxID=2527999 RepID=A0A5C5WWI8_9BACT|nr:hypothetical protein [Rubripirellula amarantea]TWT54305.1 hypothetical protein Pla22_19470 [Rubripirellula amarantea]